MRVITPETKKILEEIAARLPKVKVKVKKGEGIPVYCRMLGEAMIQNNITLKDNEIIKPNKIYTLLTGYLMVDHYKELEKLYLQTGDVNEYVRKVKEALTK